MFSESLKHIFYSTIDFLTSGLALVLALVTFFVPDNNKLRNKIDEVINFLKSVGIAEKK